MARHAPPEPAPFRPPQAELLYDDRCRGCRMLAGTVRRLDRRRVVKLTGFSQLGDRGRGLTREGLGNSLHVVRDGVLLSGGDGVLAILTTLYYPLGILERHQRLRGLVRKAYRGIADIIHG